MALANHLDMINNFCLNVNDYKATAFKGRWQRFFLTTATPPFPVNEPVIRLVPS